MSFNHVFGRIGRWHGSNEVEGGNDSMSGRMNIMRDCFQYLAHWAWWRQGIALQYPSLKLHEETLTQMLLLQMAEWLTPLGMRVELFNRMGESEHGADWEAKYSKDQEVEYNEDWEWFYRDQQSKNCKNGLRFRVQAKRLYPDGTYKLKLKQAQNLIEKAKNPHINPLYVFYNHSYAKNSDFFRNRIYCEYRSNWPQNGICRWQGGESVWGCSIAKASFVEHVMQLMKQPSVQQYSVDLFFLREGMLPWHTLFGIERPIPTDDCPAKAAIDLLPSYSSMVLRKPEEPDESIKFGPPPEWVGFLNSYARTRSSDTENTLNKLLKDLNLAGVVLIDAPSSEKSD